jgi:hypothetical protein
MGAGTCAGAVQALRVPGLRDPRIAVVALLALLVFAPMIHWGLPHATAPDRTHAWGNDDALPLAALSEMYQTFVEESPGRNIAYPWFYYAMNAGAYVPAMAYLAASGAAERPGGAYPFGLADPAGAIALLGLMTRLLNLLLSLVLVVAVYVGARDLWDRTTGTCAALCTLSMFPLAYYARVGNPDMAALAFTALGICVLAQALARGLTVARGAWLGVFVALALATKDQTGGSFLLAVPALFGLHLATHRLAGLGTRAFWMPVLASALGLAAVFVVASGLLFDPDRFAAHYGLIFDVVGDGGHARNGHPPGMAGRIAQATDLLGHTLDVMGIPMVLAAILGIGFAAVREPRTLILLLPAAGFFWMLLGVDLSRIHYLLPVALPLEWFAARGIVGATRGLPRPASAAIGVAALLSGALLLRTVDLTHAMWRDSGYEAGDWLEAHVQPGERLVHFSAPMRLPRLEADVVTVPFEGADPELLEGPDRPEFLIVIPDDTTPDRRRVEWRVGGYSVRSPLLPRALWDRLRGGEAGYRLVAQWQTPRLLPWVPRPNLSYPGVNPPIHVFARDDRAGGLPHLEAWLEAPHNPRAWRIHEPPGQFEPIEPAQPASR